MSRTPFSLAGKNVTGTEILNSSLVYYKVITRCFIAEINIVQYINTCDGLRESIVPIFHDSGAYINLIRGFSVLLIGMWRAGQARRPWLVAPFVESRRSKLFARTLSIAR